MKLIKRIRQTRRDFVGLYRCESCGHEKETMSYDDEHFHRNVIPNMKCPECGERAPEDRIDSAPKYADGVVI